jgi:hypothetical protein
MRSNFSLGGIYITHKHLSVRMTVLASYNMLNKEDIARGREHTKVQCLKRLDRRSSLYKDASKNELYSDFYRDLAISLAKFE